MCMCTHTHISRENTGVFKWNNGDITHSYYRVATMRRIDKMTDIFCRI